MHKNPLIVLEKEPERPMKKSLPHTMMRQAPPLRHIG